MTATYSQARKEMFSLIRDKQTVFAPALRVEWEGGKEKPEPPSQEEEWIRASVRHDAQGSGQASLACAHGERRWRREGTLYVQCFAPLTAGGLERAMEIACAFRDAIQASKGTASGVWFRNPTAREIGPDRNWYNTMASARFTYDEVN